MMPPPPSAPPKFVTHAELDRVTMHQLDRSRSGSHYIEANMVYSGASALEAAPQPSGLALRGLSCLILAVICGACLLFGEMLLTKIVARVSGAEPAPGPVIVHGTP